MTIASTSLPPLTLPRGGTTTSS
ncbi:hypothetical protein LINPERHAP1_LOCUS23007 [Linum perenne]